MQSYIATRGNSYLYGSESLPPVDGAVRSNSSSYKVAAS